MMKQILKMSNSLEEIEDTLVKQNMICADVSLPHKSFIQAKFSVGVQNACTDIYHKMNACLIVMCVNLYYMFAKWHCHLGQLVIITVRKCDIMLEA